MVTTHCSISYTSKAWYKHLLEMYVLLTWFTLSITHLLYALAEHMSGYSPGNYSLHSSLYSSYNNNIFLY